MITKPRALPPRRRPREPLDVKVTFRVNFGDQPEDAVTVMDEVNVPMVDSVFQNRDRIIRAFAVMLVRAGLGQPKVVSELFPAFRLVQKLVKPRATSAKR